jgi:transcription elongation GreA/GreB family factor
MNKLELKKACFASVEQKITDFQKEIHELSDGVAGKSSAGDKHETERSMVQLQQERLNHQINQLLLMLNSLKTLPENAHTVIQQGSLIRTDKGWLYIAVSMGKVYHQQDVVLTISAQTPLAIKLIGKTAGNQVQLQGIEYNILEVH